MSMACRLLSIGALLGLACGCGTSTNPNIPATITGKVTYKGTPLTGGNMLFYGEAGAYPAAIGTDGTYVGREFPIGEMTITIETETLNPDRKTAKPYPGKGKAKTDKVEMFRPPPEGSTPAANTYVKIPAKYADKTKSGLTVNLVRGNQTKDFELTD